MRPKAEAGDLRVTPALLCRSAWANGHPTLIGTVYLIEQYDAGGWREVGRCPTHAAAVAEVERLRRVRAALLAGDPA